MFSAVCSHRGPTMCLRQVGQHSREELWLGVGTLGTCLGSPWAWTRWISAEPMRLLGPWVGREATFQAWAVLDLALHVRTGSSAAWYCPPLLLQVEVLLCAAETRCHNPGWGGDSTPPTDFVVQSPAHRSPVGPWLQGHKPPRVRLQSGKGALSPHRSWGVGTHLKEVLLLGPFKSRVGTVRGVSQNLKAHCLWLYKLLVLYRAVVPPFFCLLPS